MSASPSSAKTSASALSHFDVKLEADRGQKVVVRAFEELIETVINTIQEPEVTEGGVAAVMARLNAYRAGIKGLLDSLPQDAANGSDATGARSSAVRAYAGSKTWVA